MGDFVKTAEADALLVALGVKSRQRTKVESEFTDVIRAAFEDIYPVRFQHPVGRYRVDVYFPTLNLVVEIDEFGHDNYSKAEERTREEFVCRTLGCEMLRFDPNRSGNNIAKLINAVLKYANVADTKSRITT